MPRAERVDAQLQGQERVVQAQLASSSTPPHLVRPTSQRLNHAAPTLTDASFAWLCS